ncbi:DNA-binding response regulator [Paeniglutamicibacter sp. ORCA_105]|uniref:DNA-binding response regulator n=1 Tax=Paeniglutamicibacter sp. ORCA_105 TaxID=3377336 RepID=UPI00389417DF
MQHDMTPPESDDNEPLFKDIASAEAKAATRGGPTRPPRGTAKASTSATKTIESTQHILSPGDELEIRLARMQFFKGAYTRRGINLERHFYPEPLLVTDLDLLSFDITARLTLSKTIGEAKSGTGKSAPKPLDRAIWIAGLKQLVGADGGIVITALRPSARVRDTVRSLGVTAMSLDDLDRWEKTHLAKDFEDVGSQGPSAFMADMLARKAVKGEPKLERIYWFFRSEVWFLDAWQATKRLIGALGELRGYWTPGIDDDQAAALRWLYAEAVSILTLQLVVLVGRYQASDQRDWLAVASDHLAEGAIPTNNQRAMATAFDNYLARILGELRAPATMSVETMGAFNPTPPEWAEGLIELIARLEAHDGLTELPRHTDLVVSERLVRRRSEKIEALEAVSRRDPEEFARMRRQIAAFLRGAVDIPEEVNKAISS